MRLKLLVIEDDPLQANVLASILGSHGHYVDIAEDGRYALRRLCSGNFHVALVDYRLPEIDGQTLARVVRSFGAPFVQPRLVALTSSPQDLGSGFVDFDEILPKPFKLEALLPAIERGRSIDASCGSSHDTKTLLAGSCLVTAGTTGTTGSEMNTSAATSHRILLAEDDAQVSNILKLALESRGLEVDTACDGLEAVEKLSTNSYDVVVVDFKMPKLDGLAAAKIIYDLCLRRLRPRIVALTSTKDSLIAEDPKWHLVLDDVVSKSDGMAAIISTVENCVSYKAARSQRPLEVVDLQSMMALTLATD